MLKISALLICAAVAAKTVKDEGCRVACVRSGATGGEYRAPKCRCFQDVDEDYETFVAGRITLSRDWTAHAPRSQDRSRTRFDDE